MNLESAFENVKKKGLLKTSSENKTVGNITLKQKVQLNRKGNELFNNKEYEKAKSIFLATGYSDGLCRMGDFYMEDEKPILALQMYFKAKMPSKYEPLIESVAGVIKNMMLN